MRRPSSPPAGTLAGTAVAALSVGGIAAVLLAQFGSLDGLAASVDRTPAALVDFTLIYRPAGRALFETGSPVPGFFFTPFLALLFAPFAYVGDELARNGWIAVQLASAIALGACGSALVRGRSMGLALATALVTALAFPVLHGIVWGQVSVPIVACLVGAVVAERSDKPFLAAVLLGGTVAVKYYTFAIVVAFACAGRVGIALRAVGVAFVLALVVPSAVLGGPMEALDYYRQAANLAAESHHTFAGDPNSQYLGNVVDRLGWPGAGVFRAVGYLATVVAFVSIAFADRRDAGAERVFGAFVVASLTTPLWAPTCWPHYLAYLPVCQAWVVWKTLERPAAGTRNAPLTGPVRFLALTLIATSTALTTTPWFFLVAGGKEHYAPEGMLLLADLLALGAATGVLATGPYRHNPVSSRR